MRTHLQRLLACLPILLCTVWLWYVVSSPSSSFSFERLASSLISCMFLFLSILLGLVRIMWPRDLLLRPTLLGIYACLLVSFIASCTGYYVQNSYPGGDVDPVKFLQKATAYEGGYQWIADTRTTYRNYRVSARPFFQHPFSAETVLLHIPSIMTIKDVPIHVLDFGYRSHHPRVTMTLSNAVIHIPYHEQKLLQYFRDYGGNSSKYAASLVSRELENLSKPVFAHMVHYPPDAGSFGFELQPKEYELPALQEAYGIHIVPYPNQSPHLSFTISYEGAADPELPLFKNQNRPRELANK